MFSKGFLRVFSKVNFYMLLFFFLFGGFSKVCRIFFLGGFSLGYIEVS